MTYKHNICRSTAVVLFLAAAVSAGGITASVSVDSATVGDVISLDVRLSVPNDARIVPPETEKGFGDFVVLSWSKDGDSAVYRYGIATYKPQNCTIPPLRFLAGAGIDAVYDTLVTKPIPVRVLSVIPGDTPDSAMTIRDLKAQQRTGRVSLRYWWVLPLIMLIIIAYILWNRYARKSSGRDASAAPTKPPYEEAIEAIAELEKKDYVLRGYIREHVFELSEIFKRYIGRRYSSLVPEFTTEEIVIWFELSGINREMRVGAEWFFRTSDRVKFAKWAPDLQTTHRFMKEVRAFLEATKPESEQPNVHGTQGLGAAE